MSKKIQNLEEYLQQLIAEVANYREKLEACEQEIKEVKFNSELNKNSLLEEVNNSLRGFVPKELGLELPVIKSFQASDQEIEKVLAKMYQIEE